MLNWLKSFFKKEPILGALDDTRSYDEQIKDYKFEEVVAKVATTTWVEKSPTEWRKFSVRDQDGSSSCVAQTIAKMAEVLYYIKTGTATVFSAGYYKLRSNYPEEGMIGVNALDIWRTKGIPLESLVPSQELPESKMNTISLDAIDEETAKSFKIDNFVILPGKDFETIASTIQKTGKAVMVWFTFNSNEWTDTPTILTQYPKLAHSVAAVDAVLYGGKKYLVIEDSWGKFGKWIGQRLISEEFYRARNYFAAYPINFKLLAGTGDRPKANFTKNLYFTTYYEGDVVVLQDILKYEGLFPSNVDSTGIYGAVTAKAVLEYQKKYKVADLVTLDKLGGRQVGPATISDLNKRYG